MTINDNVSFDKIPSTDINGRCIPPVNCYCKHFSINELNSVYQSKQLETCFAAISYAKNAQNYGNLNPKLR